MSDSVDGLEFEVPGEGDLEVVTLEEGQAIPKDEPEAAQAAPEGVTLTKEQYDALVAGGNQANMLGAGLDRLADTLGRPQAQPANAGPAPFDPQAVEEEAWKPNGFASAVSKVVQQLQGQTAGPMAAAMVQQNKKLLKLDPSTSEIFTAYESEIEKRVQALPPQYRALPDIYDQVYRQVSFEKMDEITTRKAQKIADEAVKKALADAGVGEGAEKAKAKQGGMFQESGSRGAAVVPKKNKVYVTQGDLNDMAERGMDTTDKEQIAAYVRNVKNRGK